MRVLVIGATGTIGKAIVAALQGRHDLVLASRRSSPEHVDMTDPVTIRALFQHVGKVDAVVCAAGTAAYRPLSELTDRDFAFSMGDKLMGQVNVVQLGFGSVADGGCFTLTSGVIAQKPEPGGAAFSLVNAAVEGFTRAAALEAPRGIRVNAVSPPWVTETVQAMGRSTAGSLPAAVVAQAYVRSIEGQETGQIIVPEG